MNRGKSDIDPATTSVHNNSRGERAFVFGFVGLLAAGSLALYGFAKSRTDNNPPVGTATLNLNSTKIKNGSIGVKDCWTSGERTYTLKNSEIEPNGEIDMPKLDSDVRPYIQYGETICSGSQLTEVIDMANPHASANGAITTESLSKNPDGTFYMWIPLAVSLDGNN